ncbi:MAG: hypothetical protein FWC60_07105 [Firmicutes bacterium]|nr:hypothetical protein [Bacillota bacterium]
MIEQIVLAAINREQLAAAVRIAAAWGLVVFGTMDGEVLAKSKAADATAGLRVYFYEPG